MHERFLVSVKVEPRSASRLISTLYILPPFFYVIKIYVRVAKNASVEINLNGVVCSCRLYHARQAVQQVLRPLGRLLAPYGELQPQ